MLWDVFFTPAAYVPGAMCRTRLESSANTFKLIPCMVDCAGGHHDHACRGRGAGPEDEGRSAVRALVRWLGVQAGRHIHGVSN